MAVNMASLYVAPYKDGKKWGTHLAMIIKFKIVGFFKAAF